MLSRASPKEALFACRPSPWILPFFIANQTLSSPFSHSEPSLSPQGAAIVHLDSLRSHNLVIWIDGFVPFLFGKGDSGVLANCSLGGSEPNLTFWQVGSSYAQIFLLNFANFASFPLVSAAPKSLPFLFSSLQLSLCPQHTVLSQSFLLSQTLWHMW